MKVDLVEQKSNAITKIEDPNFDTIVPKLKITLSVIYLKKFSKRKLNL